MSLDRAIRQTRNRIGAGTKTGLLGREDGTVRGSNGRMAVRELLSTGRYAPSALFHLARGLQLPPRFNLAVKIGYDSTGLRVILGTDRPAMIVQGLSPAVANLSDPQNSLIRLEQMQPLRCRPSGQSTKELYAEVLPARVIIDGISYNWAGGDIDLSGDIPSSGNHLYSIVGLARAGTLESATSAAQSTATALDNTDIQESLNALTAGTLPIKAFVLQFGDTALDGALTTGAIDMRQLFTGVGATGFNVANEAFAVFMGT